MGMHQADLLFCAPAPASPVPGRQSLVASQAPLSAVCSRPREPDSDRWMVPAQELLALRIISFCVISR